MPDSFDKSSSPLLEVRDLSWTPDGAEGPLWRDVSLEVAAGETVIVQGESGSGKSTLLRCIVALERASTGTVFWQGAEVGPDNIRRYRHRVLYVHQTPVPVATYVDEEMDFPRQMSRQWTDVEEAMAEEEQREMLARFELGELDWGRRFDELSVGEKQRVALVRSLSVRPQILLLDEPTASLDEANARRVEAVVEEYIAGAPERAAVWITHSPAQRKRLDGRHIDLGKFSAS